MTGSAVFKRIGIILLLLVQCVLMLSPMTVLADSVSLVGDVDFDGALTMRDTMTMFRYTSGRSNMTAAQVAAADVNGNGVVDTLDTMTLYMYVSCGIVPEPEPEPDTTLLRGVDVSYAQGEIDWATVVASEQIDFAILRCGYGQDEEGQDDVMWETNAAACEQYGMPYGAYFFCYARTPEEARGEAQHALRLLSGKSLTYPIFYDMEYSSWQGDLTNEEYAAIATVFCDTLREHGYTVGVYSNLEWWNNRLTDGCFDQWYRWVAQYNDTCDYQGIYQLWQYSDAGHVDGIGSATLDMNYSYVDFTTFA